MDALIDFGRGQIANARSTLTDKVVVPVAKQKTFDFREGAGNPLIKTPPKQAAALLAPPEFLGIQRTWEFSPAIPADGTFSGDLTLQYDPIEVPDHPDFDEAKLRIVSLDPDTGRITVLPTTLDRARRTASPRLDRLAPSYTLAVPGPFENALLTSPVSLAGQPDQSLVLVNTGPAATAVVGERPLAIPASGQAAVAVTLESGAGAQARTSARTAGVVLLGGAQVESVELTKSTAAVVVLPDIVQGANAATEIHLANGSSCPGEARLGLWNAAGSAVGVTTRLLGPQARQAESAQALFPEMPAEFTGYITAEFDSGISAASVLLTGNASAAALGAQPIPAPSRTAVRLHSPYLSLGPGAPVTILNLVNPRRLTPRRR